METFADLSKKYGKHVTQKLQTQHKQEIEELAEAALIQRRRQLELMYKEIEKQNQKIEDFY